MMEEKKELKKEESLIVDLEAAPSTEKEERFAAYIKFENGEKALFSTNSDDAHRWIIERSKDDPNIRNKISISGSDLHSFLKEEFNFALTDSSLQEDERRKIMRFVMTSSLENLFSSIDKGEDEDELKDRFQKTSYFLNEIMKCQNKRLCDMFETGLDYTAINHSINLTALCINIATRREDIEKMVTTLKGSKNGFLNEKDIVNTLSLLEIIKSIDPVILGQAGLFHDLGKAKDRELYSYEGKYNEEQREKMKKHPEDGVDILKKCGVTNKLILGGAHNHHRRFDGTGYPELNPEYPVTEFDLLLGLIDSFEAMTSAARGYKPHMSIKQALEKLKNEIESNPDNPIFPKHLYVLFVLSLGKDQKEK